jgi:hypothetical protein
MVLIFVLFGFDLQYGRRLMFVVRFVLIKNQLKRFFSILKRSKFNPESQAPF